LNVIAPEGDDRSGSEGRQTIRSVEEPLSSQREPVRKRTHVTLHLVPEPVWLAHTDRPTYQPERFAEEGFIHCTDGAALLIDVANRYYRDDSRAYLVLDIDLARVQARAIYEDEAQQYPHIYGPLEREAVTRVRRVERLPNGAFAAIGDDVS
jgi:uncharacterized protein (DUF952 family)